MGQFSMKIMPLPGSLLGGNQHRDRSRETFATLALAEAFAATFGDRRTMVYAVTAEGRSAHIKNA